MTNLAALAVLALTMAAPGLAAADGASTESFQGRDLIVYVPARLPPVGHRALVVVLHGGLGNAHRIADGKTESGLNLNAEADKHGFIVAYLSGTPVTLKLGPDFLGWNAGGCCGQSEANHIDDVGYITAAVAHLEQRYGVDPARVFGAGHSNGAIMTQRLICETHLYAAGVAISGPLGLKVETCPDARGKRILAIHGQDDRNVPIGGGAGIGVSGAVFASEAHAQQVFQRSGATYQLMIVPGAPHKLDDIDAALRKTTGKSVQQITVEFLGLAGTP
jgi:polyhydroxybutyrate depolymerase